jgi:superfamily I DNA/RNA helicase
VRGNPRLPPLTNALSERYGIPVAVSTSDDVPLDADVVNGKLTVSTYHQFKGMERDLVFVYGADSGYFTFIGRDLPDDRCPNATFVALTRARKQVRSCSCLLASVS